MQIDSFMELTKDKRPPKSLWDNPEKLEEWFDTIFDRKSSSTTIDINLDEVE